MNDLTETPLLKCDAMTADGKPCGLPPIEGSLRCQEHALTLVLSKPKVLTAALTKSITANPYRIAKRLKGFPSYPTVNAVLSNNTNPSLSTISAILVAGIGLTGSELLSMTIGELFDLVPAKTDLPQVETS